MGEEKRGHARANGETGGVHERGQALLDYVRRTLNVPASMVSSEVERRVGDVEDLVEAAIERALEQLNLPSRREVERLSDKVDELSRKLDKLGADGRPARKTAIKPATRSRTRTAAARR